MKIRAFALADQSVVIALWEACGLTRPWNDPSRDIARKLDVQADGFLVGEWEGAVIASAMFGYDGHRGWVNYLAVSPYRRIAVSPYRRIAVSPDHRGRGFGAQMMARGEAWLENIGCPKLNLQVRADNAAALSFYARLGYVEDAVASLGKRLISDG